MKRNNWQKIKELSHNFLSNLDKVFFELEKEVLNYFLENNIFTVNINELTIELTSIESFIITNKDTKETIETYSLDSISLEQFIEVFKNIENTNFPSIENIKTLEINYLMEVTNYLNFKTPKDIYKFLKDSEADLGWKMSYIKTLDKEQIKYLNINFLFSFYKEYIYYLFIDCGIKEVPNVFEIKSINSISYAMKIIQQNYGR